MASAARHGCPIEPGRLVDLEADERVAFGDRRDIWGLDDVAPPLPMAIDLKRREVRIGSADLLTPPDERASKWFIEEGEDAQPIDDQHLVMIDGRAWCVLVPTRPEETPYIESWLGLHSIDLRFTVSRNEEHVELSLSSNGRTLRLEPREHHYVLLTLARMRLEDVGTSTADRGWIDRTELLRMLGMTANAFNVAVHRARRQLLDAGVVHADRIVEVRRGERRFGTDRVEVAPM